MLQDRVEVAAAAGRVGRLADAASLDHQGFLEALVDRPHRGIVAQVPLAEDAGSIAGRGEDFGERDFVGVHQGPAQVGIDDAGAEVVSPGEQTGARRRADGRDIEVLEPDALARELVEMRRLDLGVAVNAQIAEALVVGHDEQDIRPPSAAAAAWLAPSAAERRQPPRCRQSTVRCKINQLEYPNTTQCTIGSRKHLFDHMPVHVGQAAVDAVVAEREPGVVDAQQVQDRRVQVVAVGLPGRGPPGPGVAFAVRRRRP